jgi:2-C-methyl-D-erythritol 4-phosphate cytidylyltransferase
MKIIAVIPAGGKGTRSGFNIPKQYLKINGKELIAITIDVFQKNRSVDEIIISADPFYFKLLDKIKKKNSFTKVTSFVEAGKERQDSVYNGLNSISASDEDLIIVHDAARPLLPQVVLNAAINTAKTKGNALVCIKAKDTLVLGNEIVDKFIEREKVFYVQTPQIFKYVTLKKAMDKAYKDKFTGTDESMLVRKLNEKINIIEGSVFNFKVTSKDDFKLLSKLLSK